MVIVRLDLWGFRTEMFNQEREEQLHGYGHNNAVCLPGDPRPLGAGSSTLCPFASSLQLAKEQLGGNSICFPLFQSYKLVH